MAKGNRLERRDLTPLRTDLFITPEFSGPPEFNMLCDFPQIQGGQQISFRVDAKAKTQSVGLPESAGDKPGVHKA